MASKLKMKKNYIDRGNKNTVSRSKRNRKRNYTKEISNE